MAEALTPTPDMLQGNFLHAGPSLGYSQHIHWLMGQVGSIGTISASLVWKESSSSALNPSCDVNQGHVMWGQPGDSLQSMETESLIQTETLK